MPTLSVRQSGAWNTVPANRLRYWRVNGQWKPMLDMWVRDQGQWVKDTAYSPQMATPTNCRVTSGSSNYSTINVAWDYTAPVGGLTPDQFFVKIADSNNNVMRYDAATGAQRSLTCGSIPSNTYYKISVVARYPGRPDTAYSNVVNWYVGYAAYTVYDQPVYGWGAEAEWNIPLPNFVYQSSMANDDQGWNIGHAVDGNWGTYWNTKVVDEPNGSGYQGEGIRIRLPWEQNWRITGVRVWNWRPHTVWVGIWQYGYFSGGPGPSYQGKYGPLQHNYLNGYGPDWSFDLRGFDTNIYNLESYMDLLWQNPGHDGYDWRIGVLELRLLYVPWTVVANNGPRTVPAQASRNW